MQTQKSSVVDCISDGEYRYLNKSKRFYESRCCSVAYTAVCFRTPSFLYTLTFAYKCRCFYERACFTNNTVLRSLLLLQTFRCIYGTLLRFHAILCFIINTNKLPFLPLSHSFVYGLKAFIKAFF